MALTQLHIISLFRKHEKCFKRLNGQFLETSDSYEYEYNRGFPNEALDFDITYAFFFFLLVQAKFPEALSYI